MVESLLTSHVPKRELVRFICEVGERHGVNLRRVVEVEAPEGERVHVQTMSSPEVDGRGRRGWRCVAEEDAPPLGTVAHTHPTEARLHTICGRR